MSIVDDIQAGLQPLSNAQKTTRSGAYTSAMSILGDESFDRVVEIVEKNLEAPSMKGEKIILWVQEGKVLDCGKPYFTILKGLIIEFYDYESTTAHFIRIYRLTDGTKTWVSVYIDENPETPWWSIQERED